MEKKSYGSIFFDRNKQKPNFPDAKGTFALTKQLVEELNAAIARGADSVDVEVALWSKTGPKAGKYLSGVIEIKRNRDQARDNGRPDDDDEIPF